MVRRRMLELTFDLKEGMRSSKPMSETLLILGRHARSIRGLAYGGITGAPQNGIRYSIRQWVMPYAPDFLEAERGLRMGLQRFFLVCF
jgi:hypothetical protein